MLTPLWDSQPEEVEFLLGHQHLHGSELARSNSVASPSFPALKMKQQQCSHFPREALQSSQMGNAILVGTRSGFLAGNPPPVSC